MDTLGKERVGSVVWSGAPTRKQSTGKPKSYIVLEVRMRNKDEERRHLEAEAGLAPMSTLGVVSGGSAMSALPAPSHREYFRPMCLQGVIPSNYHVVDGEMLEGIVPDGVTSAQPNPLGNGAVLLLGLSKLLLNLEGLVALLEP